MMFMQGAGGQKEALYRRRVTLTCWQYDGMEVDKTSPFGCCSTRSGACESTPATSIVSMDKTDSTGLVHGQ